MVEDGRFFCTRDRFRIPQGEQQECGIKYYSSAFEGEIRRNLMVGFTDGIFIKCAPSVFTVEHNTVLNGTTHGVGCTSWVPKTVIRFNIVTGFAWPLLFPDMIPAVVSLSLAQPAKRAGGSGELYFERDPWIGGGRNLVRELSAEGQGDEWVTPDPQLGVMIGAEDAVSKPAQMKIRLGSDAWSAGRPAGRSTGRNGGGAGASQGAAHLRSRDRRGCQGRRSSSAARR